MHELPFIKSIYNTVEEKAKENHATEVSRVVLEIGELRDFVPELINKYWEYITKGTIAEGSLLEVTWVPARVKCSQCGTTYPIEVGSIYKMRCPECKHGQATIASGRELRIVGIEIC